jgi:hypothetical protein
LMIAAKKGSRSPSSSIGSSHCFPCGEQPARANLFLRGRAVFLDFDSPSPVVTVPGP